MAIMRTRKSRFFWILLCWLGEPHQFSGIVAVAPRSLRLPILDAISLTASTSSSSSSGTIVWLQTNHQDDICLGLTGNLLYECGDTTLWVMERLENGAVTTIDNHGHNLQQQPNTNQLLFELRVVDYNMDDDYNENVENERSINRPLKKTRRERRIRRRSTAECLSRSTISDTTVPEDQSTLLHVGACHHGNSNNSDQHRWWKKLLVWRTNQRETTTLRSVWNVSPDGKLTTPNGQQCIAMGKGGRTASLASCDDDSAIVWTFLKAQLQPQHHHQQPQHTYVLAEGDENDDNKQEERKINSTNQRQQKKQDQPSKRKRAVEPAMFPELKIQSNLLFQRASSSPSHQNKQQHQQQTQATKPNSPFKHNLPFHILSNASPILMAHNLHNKVHSTKTAQATLDQQQRLHTPNTGGVTKVQRIQTHPYLTAAKNEIWTDPFTSLEFRTDLRHYLNISNQGRHTLTGVGNYRKYGIKVYGVAFYVSKRDVLSESAFVPFAGLTPEELRKRPDFYQLLQSDQIHLDRTILIKTNMQLSAETMRNSLQADWTLLTMEAKQMLAETGMQKLPADEQMLHLLRIQLNQQSDGNTNYNPARCSCMQIAPDEYSANPDCCARGTELAFTWTKENALQVRLNGRFMASFDRPDIAQGIFFEYLRYDDPISPELLANVVNGFPFLLAPLSMGIPMPPSGSSLKTEVADHDWLDHAKTQMVAWTDNARKTVVESARGIGEAAGHHWEFVQRQVWPHIAAAPGTLIKICQRDEETIQAIAQWMSGATKPVIMEDIPPPLVNEGSSTSTTPTSRGMRPHHHQHHYYLRYYYAGDEIGPLKFHPTINRLALILVHLYLLLLFIVSFPGSSYRIIMIQKRRTSGCVDSEPYQQPALYLWKERKSLSYFV